MSKGWVFGLLMAFTIGLTREAKAQRFQLEHDDYSDSIVWYVRNTGPNWVKPISMTINWFHTKPDLYVWDANPGPASTRSRVTEKNTNGNLTFKYKSTQGIGLNDTIYAGQRIPVFYSVNYNTKKTDTIMPANCILFFHDSLVADGEAPVLPKGATCQYKRVFLNSYNANSGVHYRSNFWYNLHQDMCQKYLTPDLYVMVVFDQNTFLPTSAGVVPKCPSGRYGTAFGFPKDSQIYYSFTLSDGKHIDSIISGITDGDYVALVSYPTFSQYRISAMKSRFAPIGLNTDSLIVGPFGSPDVQMLFWGRKGLSTSRGKLNTVGRFFKSGASIGIAMYPQDGQDTGELLQKADLAMFKDFQLTERFLLQFKAEAFNFTNTPRFGNPAANVSSMTTNSATGAVIATNNFMAITSTDTGSERKFRFGLRLTF